METLLTQYQTVSDESVKVWFKAASVEDIPADGGACVKYKDKQIAIFHFRRKQAWYATQNLCPHKMEMVLARGLIGESAGIPKVACPLHKRTFSLETGENLNGSEPAIAVYPVKVENGYIYIGFEE
ncbi:nitrite reductase small subunit NirD [Pontibacter sp. G13]|uniref:nitrite reductase small subunit NirD n=1 Tax=Pontibacter sp. G13 TaxID=3074898 RepID=UPI002889DDB1|nr:nitrite reductase small subunit NirD [Pontibacter sp. G13]WNJ17840.1 nitrite reductase small subunit NirD [Pontibacter sp. G13]